jgi:LCP family protein required for cell wall assembly
MLVSIPRDFYADVYRTKINAIYAFTSNKKPEDEFFYLKEFVSQIVGKPIHYFGTVRLDGVIEAVDEIGGIEVCTKDAFTAMYPNPEATPSSRQQWLYYDFVKGCQTLDGEKALVYARFRYLRKGPSYLASDFSRADRQQEIIEAAKDKILAEDISIGERAEKYWSLIQKFNETIYVENPSFEDLLAGLSFINTADRDPINVVLDPALGGINKLIYASSDPSTGYIIRARDKSYAAIRKELDLIWENSEMYKDTPTILVRNMSGAKLPEGHKATTLKDDIAYYTWFNSQDDPLTDKFAGIKIIDWTGGSKASSIGFLLKYFGIEKAETEPELYGLTQTNRKEDIAIIIGPDTLPEPSPSPSPTGSE